jgi:hypothetical protein
VEIPPTGALCSRFDSFRGNQDYDSVESGDKSPTVIGLAVLDGITATLDGNSAHRPGGLREGLKVSQMQTTEQTEPVARADLASEPPEYARVERDTASRLANIFINCPTTGIPVTTGLTTRWVVFHSLPSVAVPLRCPACGQMHRWKPQDAWIGQPAQSHDLTPIGAS